MLDIMWPVRLISYPCVIAIRLCIGLIISFSSLMWGKLSGLKAGQVNYFVINIMVVIPEYVIVEVDASYCVDARKNGSTEFPTIVSNGWRTGVVFFYGGTSPLLSGSVWWVILRLLLFAPLTFLNRWRARHISRLIAHLTRLIFVAALPCSYVAGIYSPVSCRSHQLLPYGRVRRSRSYLPDRSRPRIGPDRNRWTLKAGLEMICCRPSRPGISHEVGLPRSYFWMKLNVVVRPAFLVISRWSRTLDIFSIPRAHWFFVLSRSIWLVVALWALPLFSVDVNVASAA